MFKNFTRSFSASLRVVLFGIFLIFISLSSRSQVIFSEGFESGLPAGWTTQSYTPGANAWIPYSYVYNTGNGSVASFPNRPNANSWLFTKAISMVAGNMYVLKYFYKTDSDGLLRVAIGTAPAYLSQQKILHSYGPASGSFIAKSDTIVCEETGNYYIGFQNHSIEEVGCGTLLDDMSLTRLTLSPCANVSAGVTSSVNSVCANTSFTLTNINSTVDVAGIRYAWQKSTDGTTWTNITNGYTYQPALQVTQSVATYYRLTDTCLASGNTGVSNQVLVGINNFMNCFCTPGTVNCSGNISFSNVRITNSTINNTSGCSANGYADYTSLGAAQVYRNQNIYIQHTVSTASAYKYTVGIWIDYNHNGSFEENEFKVCGPFTLLSSVSQVNIPASALTGETRMRIKLRYYFDVNPLVLSYTDACGAINQGGEAEDYKINIGDAANCSGTVSAGTIAATAQTCPNNEFSITATNATFYQNQMRYAWQQSQDNVSWTNINNTPYLVNPLVISQNVNMYYRLADTCTATGQSALSNPIQVNSNNVFNCYCTVPATTNCNLYGIDSVSFNTIHNLSGCGTNGYSDFTNLSTTVTNGSNLPVHIRFRPGTFVKYASVWIDLNRNGQFEDNEKVFTGSSSTAVTGNIYIPFNVNSGETMMRVMSGNSSYNTTCYNYGNGETEDYKIIINTANNTGNKFCYYVKQNATGTNNGSSWANAFTSLAAAFTYMHAGDTIKIAKGIYTPGSTNTSSFELADSVVILGGFPDVGNPSNADRNFSENKTILSGEIGTSANTDNIRVILKGSNVKKFLVDGVILESGYSPNELGPVSLVTSSGTLQNVVIRNNVNFTFGSALNITNKSKVTVQNCFIDNNGGSNNISSVLNINTKSDVTIINAVIAKNKGLYLLNQSDAAVKMINSTIFKNYSFSHIHDTSSLTLQNSIFYYNGNNYAADTAEVIADVYSTISLNNTITEVYRGPGYLSGEPKFIDTLNVAGADGKYFNADDGLRVLNPCSPAINAGNNSFVSAVPTDIAGSSRIKNNIADLGAYEVQEAASAQASVIYVNKTATGLNNGSSWQNAFTDLQSAFYRCSDTIKVAAGSYPVSSGDVDASFTLTNKRVVIGGYPNTGNPTNAQMDPVANPTLLDGKITATLNSHVVLRSVNNDSTARIIGFRVVNASPYDYTYSAAVSISHNSAPYLERMDISCLTNSSTLIDIADNSRPRFYNCKFYNGFTAAFTDGNHAIQIKNSSPSFIRSYIGRDTTVAATPDAGAQVRFFNSSGIIDSCFFGRATHNAISLEGSQLTLSNSLFSRAAGRSLFTSNSSLLATNNIFTDSLRSYYTEYNGGVASHTANSEVTYNKCLFENNYTYRDGGVGEILSSNVSFKSCVFINPRSGFDAGAFYNDKGKLTLNNCIVSGTEATANVSNIQAGFLINIGDGAEVKIINTTILSGNTSSNDNLIRSVGNASLKIYNSILWRVGYSTPRNTMADDIFSSAPNNTALCDIRNSMLYRQRNMTLTNTTVGKDPVLIVDNKLYSADDGLKLCSCSPAINAGNNALNPEATDILGLNRINGTIDIGAYELQTNPTTNRIFYVKENASPAGDGLSWGTAYNSLQQGLQNNCADTLRIAKGTYKPAISSRDSSFNIYRGVALMGGYPNTGNPVNSDRNIYTNPTILSGDIGVQNDSTDNSRTIVDLHVCDTTVILDGLIIEKGNDDLNSGVVHGGSAIKAFGNYNALINNCIIRKNYGNFGGGMYAFNSNLNMTKMIFEDNNAMDGGGIRIYGYAAFIEGNVYSPKITIRNSVFTRNRNGALYYFDGASTLNRENNKIENCVFYKNDGYTAVVTLSGSPEVSIVNSIFAKNNMNKNFPGIAISVIGSLSAYARNCIFSSNTIYNMTSSYMNPDLNWQGSSTSTPLPYNTLNASAYSSHNQDANGDGNILATMTFRDIENAAGPDNIWMTADDGLQVTGCSPSVDRGNNNWVQQVPTDLIGNVRVFNNKVDMGPYETISYDQLPSSATITASDSFACPINSIQFTASATATNSNSVYQWKKNGIVVGTNSNIYVGTNLQDNDVITVTVTINNPCVITQVVTSNAITMHVSGNLTPSVTVTSGANPSCAGQEVVFLATPVNGGSNPTYQWKVNGNNVNGSAGFLFISTLADNDVVSVEMTSNLYCASTPKAVSNGLIQRINPQTPATVSISAGSLSCPGTSVTITATPVNGGSAPVYQWTVNGVNAGTNSNTFTSATLHNGDLVKVTMTSNSPCASSTTAVSNQLNIQFTGGITPAVTIAASTTNICAGSAVTFTATATNGGNNPSYQWQVNGTNVGTNSSTFTSNALQNQSAVKVILTSNAACLLSSTATSPAITITVTQAVPAAISIAGITTVTQGQSTTLTATTSNTGASPAYQWQDSTRTHGWLNIAGATGNNIVYSPVNTADGIRCLLTGGNACNPASAMSNTLFFDVAEGFTGRSARLYPNPARTSFTIDSLKTTDQWSTLEIIGTDGRIFSSQISVVNRTSIVVNVAWLHTGLYFAVLRKENGEKLYLKFIKE
jgi:hypothetical protein